MMTSKYKSLMSFYYQTFVHIVPCLIGIYLLIIDSEDPLSFMVTDVFLIEQDFCAALGKVHHKLTGKVTHIIFIG